MFPSFIRSLITSLSGGVTVKLPAAYDIAGSYETVADWSLVHPKPRIVIHKATEGTFYSDPKFKSDFVGMATNGIKRGAYHFHRKAYGAIAQAQYFCSFIRNTISNEDKLVIDIEEGGETPKQIIDWLDEVERQFSNEILIYSSKVLLDPLIAKCTYVQLQRLKKYRLWLAGYPFYPDLYSSIPSGYVPVGLGKVAMWQYSENGIVSGIVGEVDLNWLEPSFASELEAQPDVVTYPHGIKRTTGARHGWKFVLDILDPNTVRFDTVVPAQLTQVSTVAKLSGAIKGSNCGEWNDRYPDRPYYLRPINYTVSNGVQIIPRTSTQPSLMILNDNRVIIDHQPTANVKHAFTGLRYLVINGKINPDFVDNGEGHTRKIFGVNASGHLMELSTEGAYPNQGWTLTQCLNFMIQQGAVVAADFGGGGDGTAWADGELLLTPENPSGLERYLPNIFLVYKDGTNMNGTAKEILGNVSTIRSQPSRYGTDTGKRVPAGSTIEFTEIVGALVLGSADSTADKWLKLPDGNYVNYILAAKSYYLVLTQPTTDPLPAESPVKSFDLHIETATKTARLTVLRLDGTTENKDYPLA